jgi:hypothetical protein
MNNDRMLRVSREERGLQIEGIRGMGSRKK